MSPAAPGTARRDVRPPVPAVAAPYPGAAPAQLRPTVHRRPVVRPVTWNDELVAVGYRVDHPYVRRYWTAVIGPGATADLMRLTAAAAKGASLPRPVHLSLLAAEGLVSWRAGTVAVRPTIPPLSIRHARRLPPSLRERHRRERWGSPHRPQG